MATPLVEVKHLKKYFDTPRGQLHAVDDVNLTINKTVTGNNKNPGSFTFIATNDRTGITYTATIVTKKNGSYTIEGIPAGTYTVKELDNDNYEHDSDATVTVTIEKDSGSVTFKNKGTGDSYQFSSSVVNVGSFADGKLKFKPATK